ncbi:hypothetical protein CR3_0722 [Cupriavidus gilardii CR3]|uniref:Uncharacterized protein n=2 Tax=Cupriavidus gilardii TaxID=82541 RepID=A0A6N1BGX0_9BURK|nr:hypothetical protein [Cupriavidus gilardii]ALD89973.1 hypothetical protein CR3_0722 [Cupriavidus gilardii CR3]QQE08212.1 hypothetical protein IC580_03750 [Cupriavidus sp. ISTL7]KAB0598607.1 hypothetical protein F7Q96_03410 [Cupriavidus gilardii]MCT9054930.1 hypothetical protein [Cupriavidus gilardii]MCT9070739.1 hypothetical protein [Cupriavidus gilardii]
MLFRSLLRDAAAATVLVASVLGLAALSHAQGGWSRQGADMRDGFGFGARLLPTGMERTVMRAESPDHVRAQIERMEARARADSRLNGRPNPPAERGLPERTQTSDRSAQNGGGVSGDNRPANVGPGWQGSGRETTR